jgi:hypothetical protein
MHQYLHNSSSFDFWTPVEIGRSFNSAFCVAKFWYIDSMTLGTLRTVLKTETQFKQILLMVSIGVVECSHDLKAFLAQVAS